MVVAPNSRRRVSRAASAHAGAASPSPLGEQRRSASTSWRSGEYDDGRRPATPQPRRGGRCDPPRLRGAAARDPRPGRPAGLRRPGHRCRAAHHGALRRAGGPARAVRPRPRFASNSSRSRRPASPKAPELAAARPRGGPCRGRYDRGGCRRARPAGAVMVKSGATGPARRVVWRPRLAAALDAAVGAAPLTLVLAGPGTGKTALLADWSRRQSRPVRSFAAGTLADPAEFWRTLLHQLSTDSDLTVPPRAWRPGTAPELIDAVFSAAPEIAEPPVIVLDDAELLVDRDIWAGIDHLVRWWPRR